MESDDVVAMGKSPLPPGSTAVTNKSLEPDL